MGLYTFLLSKSHVCSDNVHEAELQKSLSLKPTHHNKVKMNGCEEAYKIIEKRLSI